MFAANPSGVVLYAEGTQPSPRQATRRKPASEPQLPIHSGIQRLCHGSGNSLPADAPPAGPGWSMPLISRSASSKRCHRCSNGTPAAS
jgi:hypothetical protein